MEPQSFFVEVCPCDGLPPCDVWKGVKLVKKTVSPLFVHFSHCSLHIISLFLLNIYIYTYTFFNTLNIVSRNPPPSLKTRSSLANQYLIVPHIQKPHLLTGFAIVAAKFSKFRMWVAAKHGALLAARARYRRCRWIQRSCGIHRKHGWLWQRSTGTFVIEVDSSSHEIVTSSKGEETSTQWNLNCLFNWVFPKIGVPGYPKMDGL